MENNEGRKVFAEGRFWILDKDMDLYIDGKRLELDDKFSHPLSDLAITVIPTFWNEMTGIIPFETIYRKSKRIHKRKQKRLQRKLQREQKKQERELRCQQKKQEREQRRGERKGWFAWF